MTTRKTHLLLAALGGLLLTMPACQDLDIAPVDQGSDLTYWTRPDDALNVLSTCYENLYPAEYFFFNETLSDNAFNKSEVDGSNSRNIAQGSYGPNQQRVTNEWNFHYTGIRKCNTLLANIDRIPNMDGALKARINGEARFLRAWHYFQLATWYGDVPLYTNEITIPEAQSIRRTGKAEVVNFVLSELEAIAPDLPPNGAYAPADRGRITRGAALGLRARVLLYEGRWQEVATLTDQLIDNGAGGAYSLFPSYEGLFQAANENNAEVVFDVQFAPLIRTYSFQRYFIPRTEGRLVCSIAPSQELVDDYIMANGRGIRETGSGYVEATPYQNRDPRLQRTIVYDGYVWRRPDGSTITIRTLPGTGDNSIDRDDASPTGYYVVKYFDPTSDGNLNSGLNLILMRYAEVLLMNAEAKNELGQLNEAVWNKTIRPLRQRAGFTDAAALAFPGGGQGALRTIVRRERRTELAMEGLRVFDIRRWRTAEQVLNGYLRGIRVGDPAVDNGYKRVDTRTFDVSRHYLWPVPQRELDLNAGLGQNPGW